MATDIEESDTDDHERPTPSKRQCTRFVKVNETFQDTVIEKSSSDKDETTQRTDNIEYDEAELLARERLRRWQACQVAKGFVDNIINKVLENYIMGAPPSYPLEESRFQLFRANDMEDTAIMMAIRHHGLVQSAELVPQSSAFYSDKAPGYWTDVHCSCPSNRVQGIGNFGNSVATTSANSLRLNDSTDLEEYNGLDWDLNKVDESDQEENFLERAVAEAIKKKGLSALSVDYG
ncbi:uncharacterized protein LOC128881917 isoform X1 [Hylaeus volcanicus]|uniref:uncharacterized protein LOC128881917 isoform X1 n=1 Tax=Hylaeus volcanicus TaxID=313075 RepID=UPI0023B825C2|nr:uncharacterized protein LOC128881917 isoform X1 [Hylaeus volcanicus]